MNNWEFPEIGHCASERKTFNSEEVSELIDQVKKASYEEGYTQGLLASQNESLLNFQQQWDTRINELKAIIQCLHDPLLVIDSAIEQSIVEIITQICNKLVRREMTINPELILSIIKEAFVLMPNQLENITVELNAQDFDCLKALLTNTENSCLISNFKIDTQLARGDCRVMTQTTHIDATIESRLKTLIEQVFQNANTT